MLCNSKFLYYVFNSVPSRFTVLRVLFGAEEVLGPGCFGENVFVESSEFVPEKLCVGDELECWRGEVKMPLRLWDQRPRKTKKLGGLPVPTSATRLESALPKLARHYK